ncbi:MAG: hypothetical protein EOL95_09865 [Bacteroidia bacterium]|nr:hypothetical protein [Bacteroidia bacterium]
MSKILNETGLSHYDQKIKEYIKANAGTPSIFDRAAACTPISDKMRIELPLSTLFKAGNLFDITTGNPISNVTTEVDIYNGALTTKIVQISADQPIKSVISLNNYVTQASKINSLIVAAKHNYQNQNIHAVADNIASAIPEFEKAILVGKDYQLTKRLFGNIQGYFFGENSSIYGCGSEASDIGTIDKYGKTYSQMEDNCICGYVQMVNQNPNGTNYPIIDPFTGVYGVYLQDMYIAENNLNFIFKVRSAYCEDSKLSFVTKPGFDNKITIILNPADFED